MAKTEFANRFLIAGGIALFASIVLAGATVAFENALLLTILIGLTLIALLIAFLSLLTGVIMKADQMLSRRDKPQKAKKRTASPKKPLKAKVSKKQAGKTQRTKKKDKKPASAAWSRSQVTMAVGFVLAAIISFLGIKFFWVPVVEPLVAIWAAPLPPWVRWVVGVFMFLVLYGYWAQEEEKRQAREAMILLGKQMKKK